MPAFCNELRGGLKLLAIERCLRHRQRNAVRGEDEPRGVADRGRQTLLRLAHVRGVGLDEERMIEPAADERDVEVPAARLELLLRGGDVLAVLLAARVRMVRRGDESDRVPHAVGVHLPERVRQQRMPVAHADVHRQRPPRGRKPLAQSLGLAPRQLGDRRDAVEQLVVMRDFFDPLGADAPAAKDVREKRTDVFASLRTAERNDQDGVEQAVLSYGVTRMGTVRVWSEKRR